MIIDFENMEEKAVECFKGGVGITHLRKFENQLGKIIMGKVEPGASIGLHCHDTNSEVIYVISGTADFIYDPDDAAAAAGSDQNLQEKGDEAGLNAASSPINDTNIAPAKYETVTAGGCHYCPKGHSHSLVNNGSEDVVFFAVIPEQ